MKKLLFLLLFIQSSLIFAQSFYKAKYFEIGYKDTLTKEIFWSEKEPMEPTLIAIGSRKITIHSEKLQQYFLQGAKKEVEEFLGFSCNAINLEGKNFVITFFEESEKSYFLVLEDYKNILKMHIFDVN